MNLAGRTAAAARFNGNRNARDERNDLATSPPVARDLKVEFSSKLGQPDLERKLGTVTVVVLIAE
jgi:hypothetical protein